MNLRWQSLAKGTASFLHPAFRSSWHETLRYAPEHFYQIFLRHYLHVEPLLPRKENYTVAELGPGDAIGTGLAALIAGARRYAALDVEILTNVRRNLETFDSLVALFQERRPPSNTGDFRQMFPPAKSETFPDALAQTLSRSMAPDRLAAIRADIETQSGRYVSINVPWQIDSLPAASVDWLISQSVLEHVDDVDVAYRCFESWLKPDGVMSHLVDFFSHGLTKNWNGHWAIGDLAWTLTRGKRYWLINRLPLDAHLTRLGRHGFKVEEKLLQAGPQGLEREDFAPRFRDISDEDAKTRMALLICTRS